MAQALTSAISCVASILPLACKFDQEKVDAALLQTIPLTYPLGLAIRLHATMLASMNASIPELLTAWKFYPVSAAVILSLFLPYMWGWLRMRRTAAPLATTARLISYVAGIFALALALHSPLVVLQQELLIGRAAQLILIGLLAPPLLWLACPAHVILRGLPASSRRMVVGKLKYSTPSGRLIRKLTHPLVIWLLAFSVFLLWHEPAIANWLLAHPAVYRLSLWGVWITYMLFWWHPLGTGPRLRSAMHPAIAFLFVIIGGEVPNMVTGVTLAFRQTPAYTYYDGRLPVPGLTTLQDQMVSGGMIWFLGSIVYVGVAVAILGRVFRNFESPRPPPISWDATERTIAPGLEHRVIGR